MRRTEALDSAMRSESQVELSLAEQRLIRYSTSLYRRLDD